jgi:predicted permease
MKFLRQFLSLFRREKFDADMAAEMRLHLELQIERNLAEGMSAEEARDAARRRFGGMEQAKETAREQRGFVWLEQSMKDLRHGLRRLTKAPVFTGIAVVSLALGIGASTAVFATVEALFLRGLPVRAPGELVVLGVVGTPNTPGWQAGLPYPSYEQLRDHTSSLAGISAWGSFNLRATVSGSGESEAATIPAQAVSGNFFSLLGVPAALGRTVGPEDDKSGDARAVVVLSHAYWQRRFGGDVAVLGRTILIENVPFSVVGVAPAGFLGMSPAAPADLWLPIHACPKMSPQDFRETGRYWIRAVGRLRPGISAEAAMVELDQIFQRDSQALLTRERQSGTHYGKLELLPGGSGDIGEQGRNRRLLTILLAVTGLVLVVACANVTSLQLARIAGRQHELAMLAALGAGRARLIWRLLTESILLAVTGGAGGLLLGYAATPLLFRYIPDLPRTTAPTPDGTVLLFVMLVTLGAAICAGLVPALKFSRVNLAPAIKAQAHTHTGGAGRTTIRTLVAGQIALSFCLLAAAGLFLRTVQNLKNVDLGFRRENLLMVVVRFAPGYDDARMSVLGQSVLAALKTLPGVRNVTSGIGGMLTGAPLGYRALRVEGYAPQPSERMEANVHLVGSAYFETMGIPLTHGRDFGESDMLRGANQPVAPWGAPPNPRLPITPGVAIVNETLVRRYLGAGDPIGRIVHVGSGLQSVRIVGVVKDTAYQDLRQISQPEIYSPFTSVGAMGSFQLHTTENPLAIAASVPAIVRQVDPTIAVLRVRTGEEMLDAQTVRERMVAQVSVGLSLFALALACLGLYGVLAYHVTQRTREIGVRMALGAQIADILALVLKQGTTLALSGCAVGAGAAMVLSRFIASSLYGVSGTDPLTLAGVAVLLVSVALLASWLPAQRAARITPMVALRAE